MTLKRSGKPMRVQLRRTKGWRMPAGAVSVARPSRWGNPFVVGQEATETAMGANGMFYDMACPLTRSQAVELYRADLVARLDVGDDAHPEDRADAHAFRAALDLLRGKDLACFCPLDQPCHADVLLELANT